jgi:hypothetical protein
MERTLILPARSTMSLDKHTEEPHMLSEKYWGLGTESVDKQRLREDPEWTLKRTDCNRKLNAVITNKQTNKQIKTNK